MDMEDLITDTQSLTYALAPTHVIRSSMNLCRFLNLHLGLITRVVGGHWYFLLLLLAVVTVFAKHGKTLIQLVGAEGSTLISIEIHSIKQQTTTAMDRDRLSSMVLANTQSNCLVPGHDTQNAHARSRR